MVELCSIRRCKGRGDAPRPHHQNVSARIAAVNDPSPVLPTKKSRCYAVTARRGVAWPFANYSLPPEHVKYSKPRAIKHECHCLLDNDTEHGPGGETVVDLGRTTSRLLLVFPNLLQQSIAVTVIIQRIASPLLSHDPGNPHSPQGMPPWQENSTPVRSRTGEL